jgi:hypothetical protein
MSHNSKIFASNMAVDEEIKVSNTAYTLPFHL